MIRPLLESICAQVGEPASPEQIDTLAAFLGLLQRWNGVYNLTSVDDTEQMVGLHLADCLAAMARLPVECPRLLDVGSGGGLPGAVIAVMRPQTNVTCIDAVGKKAAFVRQVAGSLRLANLRTIHGRVETVGSSDFPLITSRAFASLADFVRLTDRQLGGGGIWLAMKGQIPHDEMAALPASIEVFHVEQLQVPTLSAERCLVWMRRRVG